MVATPRNPFKPTAGKMPPELLGRESIIEDFQEGIQNGSGDPNLLTMVTGDRGTGKTVMLSEMQRIARAAGWRVVSETASPGFSQAILDELTGTRAQVTLRAEPKAFGVSLGSAEIRRAGLDLKHAMLRATEGDRGLLLIVDEVEPVSIDEMRELSIRFQDLVREDRAVGLVFAGLPALVEELQLAPHTTFLLRAKKQHTGSIDVDLVAESYASLMNGDRTMLAGERVVRHMAEATQGHPFMVQLVGYYTWQAARRRLGGVGSVEEKDVRAGIAEAERSFEGAVLLPMLHGVPPYQLELLKAVARQGEGGPAPLGEVAASLGRPATSFSKARAKLLEKGLLARTDRGELALASLQLARYLAEH